MWRNYAGTLIRHNKRGTEEFIHVNRKIMIHTQDIELQFFRNSILHIVCCDTPESILSFAIGRGFDLPVGVENPDGLFCKTDKDFYVIIHKDTTEGDVAHETTHFMNTLWKSMRQDLDDTNDEAYCHLLSYFTDRCIDFRNSIGW